MNRPIPWAKTWMRDHWWGTLSRHHWPSYGLVFHPREGGLSAWWLLEWGHFTLNVFWSPRRVALRS